VTERPKIVKKYVFLDYQHLYRNKGGWIHILEATISVLIVAGVMMSVYSDQSAREILSVSDYSYSVQNEILEGIAISRDLRLDALSVDVDLPGDPAYDSLDDYVAGKIPEGFGYLLRVCNLGDVNDYCKMDPIIFYATLDKDVFVEEVVVSAEIGEGGDATYSPKKVRLFFWEGGFPEGYCRDDCIAGGSPLFCSSDFLKVLRSECGNFDSDPCLEYGASPVVEEVCGVSESCAGGVCVPNVLSKRVCRERSYVVCDVCAETDYYPALCSGYDGGFESGDCNGGDDDEYSCWNFAGSWESACALPADLPDCPDTLSSCDNFILYDTAVSTIVPCACVPTIWLPSVDDFCSGTLFVQTSNCGTTRDAVGTKNCGGCVETEWLPSTDSVCLGSSFVQESNCGTTQNAMGTKICPTGYICDSATNSCEPAVAVLSASYSNLCKNCGSPPPGFTGGNWWYYDVTLSETGGDVGVTVNSRQKCDSGSITPLFCSTQTDIVAKFGSNYIPAGGSLVANNEWLWTDEASWTKSETYFGVDGNSNAVSDSYSFTVN